MFDLGRHITIDKFLTCNGWGYFKVGVNGWPSRSISAGKNLPWFPVISMQHIPFNLFLRVAGESDHKKAYLPPEIHLTDELIGEASPS